MDHVGGVKPWAGVHPLVQVCFLGVHMAVKVDDAHFVVAQMAADPPQCGETDGVVSPEDDGKGPGGKHVGHPLGDLIEGLFVAAGKGENIPHVAEGDLLPKVHAHFIVVGGVEGRHLADALGAEACSRAIGGAAVVGNPHHGNVMASHLMHVFQVGRLQKGVDPCKMGQLPPGEGGNAAIPDAVGSVQAESMTPFHLLLPARLGKPLLFGQGLKAFPGRKPLKRTAIVGR